MQIISAESLSKNYGSQKAVDDISFTVEKGQVFGFLGPNGSGKTTTIGMLLGIINKSSGAIRLFETDDLDAARLKIGATLETPNFYPYLSGRDNLKVVAKIKNATDAQIDASLDLVQLASRQKDKFKTYSLGMKQRLAIASATLSNPDLIILDEPTNGLDPEGIREVRDIINRLSQQGKTIFLSSHLLDEVEKVCSHVAVIKKGKLLRSGSIREIVSKNPFALLDAADKEKLKAAVSSFSGMLSVNNEQGMMLVELKDENLAALNRHLVEQGVYVSHLALRRKSLEEVFLEITQK
jgi:ABC-type multidrug transport system ATPase subunit